MKSVLVFLVAAVLLAGLVAVGAQPETKRQPAGWGDARAAASAIAAGRSLWVDTMPDDPQSAIINARVDVGTLKIVGDEIECIVRWPSQPGALIDFRHDHPDVAMPDGSYAREVARVQCHPDGPLHYAIEMTMLGPDGTELYRYPVEPAASKAEREAERAANEQERFGLSNLPYGRSWPSLACAAVAARCRGEALAWPPKDDLTPLEYSQRVKNMRLAYGAPFVPRCTL